MAGEGERTDESLGSDGDGRFNVPLRGVSVDSQTRCVHYHTPRDVMAIAFPCCETFYPCRGCHEACCEHDARRWPPERFDEQAILCGVCRERLSIESYLSSNHCCPSCGVRFNPGCAKHWDRYFAME